MTVRISDQACFASPSVFLPLPPLPLPFLLQWQPPLQRALPPVLSEVLLKRGIKKEKLLMNAHTEITEAIEID